MSKQSQAWKDLERTVAKALGGRRVLRGGDFSESGTDVVVPDFPGWKIDCKYRKSHAHHTLLKSIEEKYCEDILDVPVLVTKHHRQRGAVVSMRLEDFERLLNAARVG